jgi:hypothetical protein
MTNKRVSVYNNIIRIAYNIYGICVSKNDSNTPDDSNVQIMTFSRYLNESVYTRDNRHCAPPKHNNKNKNLQKQNYAHVTLYP